MKLSNTFFTKVFLILPLLTSSLALSKFDHQHTLWASVLKKHVTVIGHQSKVNYSQLQKAPQELDQYLSTLEKVSPKEYETFSEKEKISFLTNAYNAFTLKHIINHYPVKSIKKIGGWFKSPWKIKFFTLLGQKMNLDHVEHEILRKKFDEARIHFALVCAAKSCPPLRNFPYLASKLDEQFENSADNFFADKERNRLNPKKKKIEVSSIFKWFGEDFEKSKKYGSLKKYISEKIPNPNNLDLSQFKIGYLDYDWSLNE